MPRPLPQAGLLIGLALIGRAAAAPSLEDPTLGTLELVTPPSEQGKLDLIDGLAFDSFGNLFGVREIAGPDGGVVAIDKDTGAVAELVTGIPRADQIDLHPAGDFFVTSEVFPADTTDRIYRIAVTYGLDHAPVSATATSVSTVLAIDNPEGIVVLATEGPYGHAGALLTCEDKTPGRVLRVDPATGVTKTLATDLRRPEGLAFGSFAGGADPGLFCAETLDHNVLRVTADGELAVLGSPAEVALTAPDNVEFGPDGFLYVTEDRPLPLSRIVRVAADGTHTVFATGFGQAAGLAFDPGNGDLYIAEQDLDRVWRVRFTVTEARATMRRGREVVLACLPNPFQGEVVVHFELPRAATVHLGVHDVTGRRLQTLLAADLPGGPHRTVWSGRDSAGDPVAPGVYFVSLESGDRLRSVKLSKLR